MDQIEACDQKWRMAAHNGERQNLFVRLILPSGYLPAAVREEALEVSET